ncbi:MAG TPA: EamA family transporter [Acidobacteriaceae bacterium]|nr:EamA family transporter [Acidobacteriaceae bacterium]
MAFLCVYFLWGATYAAARIGVQQVPAPLLAGVRLTLSGSIVLAFFALRGKQLLGTRNEMIRLTILGMLLLFGGNVGLVWAEFYLPSGFSALLVAVVPIYVALIEWMLPHGERLQLRGQFGLVLGLVGLGVLVWPSARIGLRGDTRQIVAIGVLLAGALSWTCGSVLARRSHLTLNLFVCAGWEMIVAGACDILLGTLSHDWRLAHWNHEAFSAIGYLIVGGSLIGFSAYMWLVSHVPVAKIATYAYVNPVVAVLIGLLVLGERLQRNEILGMAITLFAVFLVTSSRMQDGRPTAEIECVPVETNA